MSFWQLAFFMFDEIISYSKNDMSTIWKVLIFNVVVIYYAVGIFYLCEFLVGWAHGRGWGRFHFSHRSFVNVCSVLSVM